MIQSYLHKIELLVFKVLYYVNNKIDSRFFSSVLRRLNNRMAYTEMKSHSLTCVSRPFNVHFLSQYECNYNCEFCGFDYRTKPLQQQLTFDKYKTILANLNPEIITGITFSGQGEPLLCNDLVKMAGYTRSRFPHIALSINTNGAKLSGELSVMVADYFNYVIISLHSLIPTVHAQITGSDSLSEVISNIRFMRKHNPHIGLVLYFAYTMRNIGEINDHLRFCHELGNCEYVGAYAKFYQHKKQFSDRRNRSLYRTLDTNLSLYNHQEYSDKLVQDAMTFAQTLNVRSTTFPPLFKKEPCQRLGCSFPYLQIMVNVDGQVFPCGGSDIWMYDEIASGLLNFGNLLDEHIDNIWNLPDYAELRSASFRNCHKADSHCANCSSMGFLVDSGKVKESHFIIEHN